MLFVFSVCLVYAGGDQSWGAVFVCGNCAACTEELCPSGLQRLHQGCQVSLMESFN